MRPVSCKSKSYTVASPVGDIVIVTCKDGLHSVKQCDPDDSTFLPNEQCCVELKNSCVDFEHYKPAQECVSWLQKYFMGQVASTQTPPICSSVRKDNSFCGRVWQILPSAAPFGTTITYKDLAGLCGNEKACRAAGHAMSTNPISYIVPCHRVITTSNGIGNYSQGKKNSIKKWLLDFEKNASKRAL